MMKAYLLLNFLPSTCDPCSICSISYFEKDGTAQVSCLDSENSPNGGSIIFLSSMTIAQAGPPRRPQTFTNFSSVIERRDFPVNLCASTILSCSSINFDDFSLWNALSHSTTLSLSHFITSIIVKN